MASQLRFDLRLETKDGKDAHREFKGTIFREDGSMAIVEIKKLAHKVDVLIVAPQSNYEKPDRSGIYSENDLEIGSQLVVDGTTFVVTKVEGRGLASNTAKQLSKFNWFNELDPDRQTRLAEIQTNMREKIKERGATTIIGLGKHFSILNDNRDGVIDEREFSKAIREYGFNVADEDVKLILKAYDRDGNGSINYEEFLRGVRGEMNEFRKSIVLKAFKKLDANKNGVIQADDIRLFYNAKGAEGVKEGKKGEDDVLNEFLNNFDSIDKDGTVTYEEFEEYYNNISTSIDDDVYFMVMMNQAWKL